MKKIFAFTSMLLTGLFLFTSCERERIDYGLADDNTSGNGGSDADGPFGILARPGLSYTRSVDVSDYTITLYNDEGTQVDLIRYGDIGDDGRVLRVGHYRLTASSHTPQAAEWDNPWYYGETEFDIAENQINDQVKVTCKPHNLEVEVAFEESLWELMDSRYTVLVEVGEGQLTYTRTQHDQGQLGYFTADPDTEGRIFWSAFFNGEVDGEPMSQQAYGQMDSATRKLTITFKLKPVNPDLMRGTAAPSLQLDASVIKFDKNYNITVEENLIPEDSGEPGEPVDPPLSGEDQLAVSGKNFNGAPFDIRGSITLPAYIPEEGIPVVVAISAPAGIQELNVDIVSEQLTPDLLEGVNLSSHLDLVHPGEFRQILHDFGFPLEDEVTGETAIDFDITKFTPLLGIYGAGTHRFVLHVSDAAGHNVTETLTIVTQD